MDTIIRSLSLLFLIYFQSSKLLLTYSSYIFPFNYFHAESIKFEQRITNSTNHLPPTMSFLVSDELLGTFVPIIVYWIYSGFYVMLGDLNAYRLHTKAEEDSKNIVSKIDVVKGVVIQQAFQIAVSLSVFTLMRGEQSVVLPQPSFYVIILQFIVAMVVMDSWQYFTHRMMHINKFLYKHIHSKHHALVVPYPYGAIYNHLLEGLIVDIVGGVLCFLASGMTPRTAIYFFSFTAIKSVDDHSSMWLPGNLLHVFFHNNSAYHDIHHQLYGTKYNFSQPFFITWDKIFRTHMPYTLERRKEGGFEARPIKKIN